MSELRIVSTMQLSKILRDHKAWLKMKGVSGHRADLSNADLTDIELHGVDLSAANLSGVFLRNACLSSADLRFANITGADLSDANLVGAKLEGANLSLSNLAGADLTMADLTGSDLTSTNLEGVKLGLARLDRAALVDAHLPCGPEVAVPGLDRAVLALIMSGKQPNESLEGTLNRAAFAMEAAPGSVISAFRHLPDLGPEQIVSLIYAATYPDRPVPDWHGPASEVMADIRDRAGLPPMLVGVELDRRRAVAADRAIHTYNFDPVAPTVTDGWARAPGGDFWSRPVLFRPPGEVRFDQDVAPILGHVSVSFAPGSDTVLVARALIEGVEIPVVERSLADPEADLSPSL